MTALIFGFTAVLLSFGLMLVGAGIDRHLSMNNNRAAFRGMLFGVVTSLLIFLLGYLARELT